MVQPQRTPHLWTTQARSLQMTRLYEYSCKNEASTMLFQELCDKHEILRKILTGGGRRGQYGVVFIATSLKLSKVSCFASRSTSLSIDGRVALLDFPVILAVTFRPATRSLKLCILLTGLSPHKALSWCPIFRGNNFSST